MGDFGVFGLWLWNSDVWTHLTWFNPDSIISGDVNADSRAELIGDFGTAGAWLYDNSTWTALTDLNPESLIVLDHIFT